MLYYSHTHRWPSPATTTRSDCLSHMGGGRGSRPHNRLARGRRKIWQQLNDICCHKTRFLALSSSKMHLRSGLCSEPPPGELTALPQTPRLVGRGLAAPSSKTPLLSAFGLEFPQEHVPRPRQIPGLYAYELFGRRGFFLFKKCCRV